MMLPKLPPGTCGHPATLTLSSVSQRCLHWKQSTAPKSHLRTSEAEGLSCCLWDTVASPRAASLHHFSASFTTARRFSWNARMKTASLFLQPLTALSGKKGLPYSIYLF